MGLQHCRLLAALSEGSSVITDFASLHGDKLRKNYHVSDLDANSLSHYLVKRPDENDHILKEMIFA